MNEKDTKMFVEMAYSASFMKINGMQLCTSCRCEVRSDPLINGLKMNTSYPAMTKVLL
ncbi:hypothetical protein [Pedobacter punctiformis]|uniref:Uncharacterized protein n=1 Tax=Pedobacter punctiformis TaxID=3004097 RepID=A0ABT4L878_9SPHI|nr:hypothetical protein [Pedobacter sp. HCMS5-2]MCZ4243902.1 hypothetical protein [Pedobacter sp. HCMS5-2]